MILILTLFLILAPILLFSFIFLNRTVDRHRRRRLPLPPGPKGWPLVGNLFQLGSNHPTHQTFLNLSRSHGCDGLLHLRFGIVHVIVLSTASAVAKCFCNHDVNLSSRPLNSTSKLMAYNAQDLIMAPYGPRWRMMRKICFTHLFSNKALNEFQDVRHGEVVRLVRGLAGRKAVVNIGEMVSICAINALSVVLVGRRVFAGDEEALQFKKMAVELTRLAGESNMGEFLPWIDWLDLQGLTKKIKKSYGRFAAFIEKILVEHRMNADDQFNCHNHIKDFLTKLIEIKESAEEEEDKLTNINIKALLQDMFIAGTDTVSVVIEWTLAELIRHPKILARAQQEIDSIIGYNRLISDSDLSKFSFLHSIVKESLRLHPPAPLSVPRMAIQDCVVDGYLIPEGATVLANAWAIGRDPVSWPNDTLEFNPDRFGPGSLHENVDVKGNDFELIPFGVGRRICAGMNLGLRMVHLVTAVLVHSFDWRLPDGQMSDTLDMEESTGITMRKRTPLMVKAIPRLAPQVYI